MVCIEMNPNFTVKDALDVAKGKFTCLKCGKEFEKSSVKLPGGKYGAVCPWCGHTIYHGCPVKVC